MSPCEIRVSLLCVRFELLQDDRAVKVWYQSNIKQHEFSGFTWTITAKSYLPQAACIALSLFGTNTYTWRRQPSLLLFYWKQFGKNKTSEMKHLNRLKGSVWESLLLLLLLMSLSFSLCVSSFFSFQSCVCAKQNKNWQQQQRTSKSKPLLQTVQSINVHVESVNVAKDGEKQLGAERPLPSIQSEASGEAALSSAILTACRVQ